MITRTDVAYLCVGDVVEVTVVAHDKDATLTVRGPLKKWCDGLALNTWLIRDSLGAPGRMVAKGDLTLVSRAKPPLYVNSDKTEPDPGDVVRDESAPPHASGHTWHFLQREDSAGRWWRFDDTGIPFDKGARLRLLVDGRTGQVVP